MAVRIKSLERGKIQTPTQGTIVSSLGIQDVGQAGVVQKAQAKVFENASLLADTVAQKIQNADDNYRSNRIQIDTINQTKDIEIAVRSDMEQAGNHSMEGYADEVQRRQDAFVQQQLDNLPASFLRVDLKDRIRTRLRDFTASTAVKSKLDEASFRAKFYGDKFVEDTRNQSFIAYDQISKHETAKLNELRDKGFTTLADAREVQLTDVYEPIHQNEIARGYVTMGEDHIKSGVWERPVGEKIIQNGVNEIAMGTYRGMLFRGQYNAVLASLEGRVGGQQTLLDSLTQSQKDELLKRAKRGLLHVGVMEKEQFDLQLKNYKAAKEKEREVQPGVREGLIGKGIGLYFRKNDPVKLVNGIASMIVSENRGTSRKDIDNTSINAWDDSKNTFIDSNTKIPGQVREILDQAIRSTTDPGLKDFLKRAKAKTHTGIINKAEEESQRTSYNTEIAMLKKEAQQDPVTFVNNRNGVAETASNAALFNPENWRRHSEIQHNEQSSRSFLTRKMLSKNQMETLAFDLNHAGNPDAVLAEIGKIESVTALTDDFPLVINQLVESNTVDPEMGVIPFLSNRRTQKESLRLMGEENEIRKNFQTLGKSEKDNFNDKFQKQFQDSLNKFTKANGQAGTERERNIISNLLELTAKNHYNEVGGDIEKSMAVAQRFLDQNYAVVEGGRSSMLIPRKQLPANSTVLLEETLDMLANNPSYINELPGNIRLPSSDTVFALELADTGDHDATNKAVKRFSDVIVDKSRFVLNAAGDGMILHVPDNLGKEFAVYTDQNSLMEIKFKDLPAVHASLVNIDNKRLKRQGQMRSRRDSIFSVFKSVTESPQRGNPFEVEIPIVVPKIDRGQ